jgi:hypothetical protein
MKDYMGNKNCEMCDACEELKIFKGKVICAECVQNIIKVCEANDIKRNY